VSKINQIQNRIRELEGGVFQKLADAYLHKKGYERINPLGSVVGSNKVRKGTPDTLITLPNGKYVFAEHTTAPGDKIYGKLKSDLRKCLDEAKTGVPVRKIEEVIFCHTSNLSAQEENALAEECQERGVNLNIFGIGPLSFDLSQKYLGLARDFLEVEVDTGQIVHLDEFVAAYNKNKLATGLDTSFHFREEEVEQTLQGLEENHLVIVSGRAGVGKSRLALECCERFKEAHPGYETRCVFNRGPDLFDDLRVHFSEPGHYLILIDDANRLSGFEYVLQLLQHQREDQQIKVVATVRDYALGKVRKSARSHGGGVEVLLRPFEEEQIKQLIEDECDIRNHLFLERIADIARGNPRLAIMTAKVAKQKGTLHSIGDVSTLYDEYFASIREDLEELGTQDLLKVAGIVTFFRAVDRSNDEMVNAIEEAFGISSKTLWKAAQRLHDLEVFDMYEDEVVRISDQVLATYLFYLAFFKERVLDFAALLDHFFPRLRHRLIDAINPVLNSFDSDPLMKVMRPQVDRSWRSRQEVGDEEALLHLMDVFWFLKETDTLLCISERVSAMEPEAKDLSGVRVGSNSNIPSPSILSVLSSFAYSDEHTLRMALDLLFRYLEKRPSDLPLVLHLLIDQFGFKHTSYIRGYAVQRTVIEALEERLEQGEDEIFSKLFLAVAEKYLHTHFSSSESKGSRTIQIVNFDLTPTPELTQLRGTVWSCLFHLYRVPTLRKEVLGVLQSYSKYGCRGSGKEVAAQDSAAVLPFVRSELNPGNYRHCAVVHEFLDLLNRFGVAFDSGLRDRFRNVTYDISEVLLNDWAEKRNLDLDYEQYRQYKKRRIEQYFAGYNFDNYEQLVAHCVEIRTYLDQGEQHQLEGGVTDVFLALATRKPHLYAEVLERYLERGDPLRLRSLILVENLVRIRGITGSYEVLDRPNYPTKRHWLFGYFQSLPHEKIKAQHLSQIYALYREAERGEIPYSFDFLLKYRPFDRDVVARVTQIVTEKVQMDADFTFALSGLFNPHTEANKVLIELFADHLDLLQRAYFAALDKRDNEDYDRRTLARILDVDSGFMMEYIDHMYERKEWESRTDDIHDSSFLWMRDDYKRLMVQAAERIYEREQQRSILSGTYLETFFKNDEDKPEVRERQDRCLEVLIERRYSDPDFVQFLFDVIAQLAPERRRSLLSLFVKRNKSFEDFRRLLLQPSSYSWSGSAVPVLQGRAEYLESVLPLLNTVDLLQHKQYVEQHIQAIRLDIEREKKKDFIGD
jgi:hypothetical protein